MVLIIGILTAIALPQYQVTVEKARTAEALTLLRYIQNAYIMKKLEEDDHGYAFNPQDVVELSDGTWSEDNFMYCTNNFLIALEDPDITAIRTNHITKDCSGLEQKLYDINIQVPPEPGWKTFKQCTGYTDVGYKVCNSLGAQGFDLIDSRNNE